MIYPVGSIYISINNTNPGTFLGGTTWISFGSGKTIVGVDSSDDNFKIVEKTGGEKTHTLVLDEMPTHRHVINRTGRVDTGGYISLYGDVGNGDKGFITEPSGGSQPHNNLQPYITVYMWKRTK